MKEKNNGLTVINAAAVLPDRVYENCFIHSKDGIIVQIGSMEEYSGASGDVTVDAEGAYVLSGFVDTHIHGGGGADFMDLSPSSFERVVTTHAKNGTTAICPTAMASELPMLAKLFTLYREMERTPLPSTLLGLHLEGPFLSPDACGAQKKSHITVPSKENVDFLLENGGDIIRRIGIAPEVDGALEAGMRFRANGALVSVAHSNALFEDVERAFACGFTHVTHLHCATPGLRKVNEIVRAGIPEAAYLLPEMSFELIGDGYHIPPQVIRLAATFKGKGKVSLITDAMRAAGESNGITESYLGEICPENRVIIEGGVAKLPDRSSFAGSIATSAAVFRNACKNTGLPLTKISEMMSYAPALSVGAEKTKGTLEVGKDADMVIANHDFDIIKVVSMGNVIR